MYLQRITFKKFWRNREFHPALCSTRSGKEEGGTYCPELIKFKLLAIKEILEHQCQMMLLKFLYTAAAGTRNLFIVENKSSHTTFILCHLYIEFLMQFAVSFYEAINSYFTKYWIFYTKIYNQERVLCQMDIALLKYIKPNLFISVF